MIVKKGGYVPEILLIRGDTNPGGGSFGVLLKDSLCDNIKNKVSMIFIKFFCLFIIISSCNNNKSIFLYPESNSKNIPVVQKEKIVLYGVQFENNNKLYSSFINFFLDKDYKIKIKYRFSSSNNRYYFYHPKISRIHDRVFKTSNKILMQMNFDLESYISTRREEISSNLDFYSNRSYSKIKIKTSDWISKISDGNIYVKMTIISNFHNSSGHSDTIYFYGKKKLKLYNH